MNEYTLFELNEYIRRFVALNLPQAVWVSAELASVSERRGHWYLDIIEKAAAGEELRAQAQAILWERTARRWQRENKLRLRELLQGGRQVKLQVQIEFHERYGLKFMVTDLDPHFTLGQLALQRQATIEHLHKSGVWDLNRNLPLALAPQRLAIISSPVAAGLQDFLDQLRSNPYGYHYDTTLFPAAMQGTQASVEIRKQLRTIGRRAADYDAIVIIRGGGARTDLSDFDERELCTVAAKAPLPILSGIGHQTDQSILDMLAHTSLKTPTAVADFLVNRLLTLEQHLLEKAQWNQQLTTQRLAQARSKIDHCQQLLHHQTQQYLQQQYWQLDHLAGVLPQRTEQRLRQAQQQLDTLEKQHLLLRLETSLNRGFSLTSKEGQIITTAKDLTSGDTISIRLAQGEAEATVVQTSHGLSQP
ncbi:MAG: exodeoxyribonuclease VII large subunit [Bacteroidota bacterium]